MSNSISDLQDELFATLRALRDKETPMDIERAKAITDVAQVIINSAKSETEFLKVNGSVDSQFFHKPAPPQLPNDKTKDRSDDDGYGDGDTHQTRTGIVNVNVKNGQRIVSHKLR